MILTTWKTPFTCSSLVRRTAPSRGPAEHGANWVELKDPRICRRCYWAYPEEYEHIAMRELRRVDILWSRG